MTNLEILDIASKVSQTPEDLLNTADKITLWSESKISPSSVYRVPVAQARITTILRDRRALTLSVDEFENAILFAMANHQ